MGLGLLAKPMGKFIEFAKVRAKRDHQTMGATTEAGQTIWRYELCGNKVSRPSKNSNAKLTVA